MKVYAATLLYHEIEIKWHFLKFIYNITNIYNKTLPLFQFIIFWELWVIKQQVVVIS